MLVGDSLGSVLYNYKSTKEVTLNTMIEHSKSVRQGVKKKSHGGWYAIQYLQNSKKSIKKCKKK